MLETIGSDQICRSAKKDIHIVNNPCPRSEYLSIDGQSCISSCDAPLKTVKNINGNFCRPPCDSLTDFYNVDTGKCQTSCESPYLTGFWGPFPTCAEGTDPMKESGISFFQLARMIRYIRYVDTKYPARLKQTVAETRRTLLSLRYGFIMPTKMKTEFSKQSIPDVFGQYNLHSSFLVNYWKELTSLLIVLLIGLIAIALEHACKKLGKSSAEDVFARIKTILGCNFLLLLFATGLDDVILCSALELHSLHFDNTASVFSFIMCLLMLGLTAALLVSIAAVVTASRSAKAGSLSNAVSETYSRFLTSKIYCQLFYRGFQDSQRSKQTFYLVYVIRIFLPMFFTCILYKSPIAQTVIYLIISISIIVYITVTKPFTQRINYVQLLIVEYVVLVIHICLIQLVILDRSGFMTTEAFNFFGNVVVAGNFIINFVAVFFLGMKLITGLRLVHKLRKESSEKLKAAWFQLAFWYFQNGALGFEYVQVGSYTSTSLSHNNTRKVAAENSMGVDTLKGGKAPANGQEGGNIGLNPFHAVRHMAKVCLEEMEQDLIVFHNNTNVKLLETAKGFGTTKAVLKVETKEAKTAAQIDGNHNINEVSPLNDPNGFTIVESPIYNQRLNQRNGTIQQLQPQSVQQSGIEDLENILNSRTEHKTLKRGGTKVL